MPKISTNGTTSTATVATDNVGTLTTIVFTHHTAKALTKDDRT